MDEKDLKMLIENLFLCVEENPRDMWKEERTNEWKLESNR